MVFIKVNIKTRTKIKLFKDGRMTTQKDDINLSNVFQPKKITEGKEEQVKFE